MKKNLINICVIGSVSILLVGGSILITRNNLLTRTVDSESTTIRQKLNKANTPNTPFKKNTMNSNSLYPSILDAEIKEALNHYPVLSNVDIEFRLVESFGDKVMAAQPKALTILGSKSSRKYVIKISTYFKIDGDDIRIADLPSEVLVGWIGHELGHIMDYENRSALQMVNFGIGYLLSSKFVRKAENAADTYAIQHGLSEKIIATKNYILNHASIPQAYKNKIRRLYMSPEQVVEKVHEIESALTVD